MAGPTGLEPATSGLTGQCANQLHHDPHHELRLERSLLRGGQIYHLLARSVKNVVGLAGDNDACAAIDVREAPRRATNPSTR